MRTEADRVFTVSWIGSTRGPGQHAHFEEPENVEPVTVIENLELYPLGDYFILPGYKRNSFEFCVGSSNRRLWFSRRRLGRIRCGATRNRLILLSNCAAGTPRNLCDAGRRKHHTDENTPDQTMHKSIPIDLIKPNCFRRQTAFPQHAKH